MTGERAVFSGWNTAHSLLHRAQEQESATPVASIRFPRVAAGMEKAPQLGKLRGLKAALEVWVFGGGTAAEKILLFCLRGLR